MSGPLGIYLAISALLFVIGLIGFVTRRNLIIMFLCTEMMFQGIIINLIAFSRLPLPGLDGQPGAPLLEGQVFALFLLAIAAAEAALGLALVVLLYRNYGTLDANAAKLLKDE